VEVNKLPKQLQDKLQIPTIYQRLYLKGEELEDSSATVENLAILANDVLALREETEGNATGSDTDTTHAKKKRKQEERGFGGTLLGGKLQEESRRLICDQATPPEVTMLPSTCRKFCGACTFENALEVSTCDMCSTPFT
jgi:hypothetical protein